MERQAFLAGKWYPGDSSLCQKEIEKYVDLSQGPSVEGARVLVAPHAGWVYSGQAAVQGYRVLAELNPDTDLVVIFGSHRSVGGGHTLSHANAWQSPLGPISVALDLVEKSCESFPFQDEPSATLRPDNAVEVHIPFMRYFFPRADMIMCGVAPTIAAIEVGQVIAQVCIEAKRRVVFIGSTDLTHYGPNYGFSPQGTGVEAEGWVRDVNDKRYLGALLTGELEDSLRLALAEQSACCPGAVLAAMAASQATGHFHPTLLEHYLSSDVYPSPSFVGYGSLIA